MGTFLCLAAQIRKIGDAPLREVLSSLGGWPVTVPNWEPPQFSIEVLLGRLRGDYNEGVLVEQWVGPDDKNSSVNIIQVSIRDIKTNKLRPCKMRTFVILLEDWRFFEA